ncbi:hypothetical protein CTA1_5030 [Colletotrichum tanaceti]|uniref:Uncharacterized protein n=1 Tax=Colletotrichum tanaceti TaxID=1306861 RepID=A0A4U6XGT8_9PEZI|nr:hypothetical protein CTA1_5030 [Colletotrichum tanaceti]
MQLSVAALLAHVLLVRDGAAAERGGRLELDAANGVVVAKDAVLEVGDAAVLLVRGAAEVDALGPLPGLDAREEEHGADEDDAPLPGDGRVLEDGRVEHGDVDEGEDGDEADDDGEEEQLVAPRYLVLLGCMRKKDRRMLTISQARKRANHVRLAKHVARARNTVSHWGEYVLLQLFPKSPLPQPNMTSTNEARQRAAVQRPYTSMSSISSQVKTPTFICFGEHGEAALVLEDQTDEERAGLGDVAGQDVQHELLDVVKHAAALLDGVEDRGEVVVGEDYVRGLLGHVGAALSHGDADIGALQTGGVVDAVARHGHEAPAPVQGLDHAHLCLGGAAGDDQGQVGELVNVVVRELVKVVGGHDHGLCHVGRDVVHARRQDAHLERDGPRRLRVVAGEHVHADAGLVELLDRRPGPGPRRVVEADEPAERDVLFVQLAVQVLVAVDDANVVLAGKGQHAQSQTGESLHVGQDILLNVLGELDNLVAHLDRGAGRDDALDGALCEEPRLVASSSSLGLGLRVLKDDRHLLDVRVKGELGNLLPAVALSREPETVPVEARGKDLDGDLGRVAARVPLAVRLVDVGQVGERRHVEVVGEHAARLDAVLGLRVGEGLAVPLLGAEVNVLGLVDAVAEIPDGGVERLGFQALQLADNDVALDHTLGTRGHGDGQDDDQGGRDHGQAGGDGVDDDLLGRVELVGAQDDDGADDGDAKEEDGELGQLPLERRSHIHSEEASDGVGQGQRPRLEVPADAGGAVLLALDVAAARVLAPEGGGDLSDLGVHARGEDDAASAALGDGRGAVGHVETVAGPRLVVKGQGGLLADGKRLARQQGLVGLEVDGLEDADVGGDGVARLELDHVAGDDLDRRDGHVSALTHRLGGGGAEGSKGVHGLCGLELLVETDGDVEQDDTCHDTSFDPRSNAKGSTHGENENLSIRHGREKEQTYQGHGVGDLSDKDLEGLDARLFAELVTAILVKASLCVVRSQAVVRVSPELLDDLLDSQGVGRTGDGPVGLARDVVGHGLGLGVFLSHDARLLVGTTSGRGRDSLFLNFNGDV